MKPKIRIAVSGITSAVILASVGALVWWDEQPEETVLIAGAETATKQQIQISDSSALLACPSAPALASLGTDEAGLEPDLDEGGDDEPRVGVFDPDYVPDTGDATSQITAFSLADAERSPARAELKPLLSRQEQAPERPVELEAGTNLHSGKITVRGPAALSASTEPHAGSPLIAGLRYGAALHGDLRGIAAAPCIATAAEQWLVGGQTEAGSSAELQLNNPSDTPASVRVDLWGAAGPIEVVGTSSILVPPGEQRSVLLEGLAPQERRLAVRVKSTGAQIGAVIQDVRTLGLRAAGVDYVTPAVAPETVINFPGVQIEDSDTSFIRLLAPGADPGDVDVHLVGSAGDVPAADLENVRIPGESVSEISLSGIPAGTYTVQVESTVPVTGSVFVATGGDDEERDIAWMSSALAETAGYFALPNVTSEDENGPSIDRKLVIAAGDKNALVNVQLFTTDGGVADAEQVFIEAGRSREFVIPDTAENLGVTGTVIGLAVESDVPVWSGLALRTEGEEPAGITLIPATSRSALPSVVEVRYIP